MKRKPSVSGQFYPSSPSKLNEEISSYLEQVAEKEKVIGVVSPHAGIMYSGKVAGAVFSRIEFPHTFILIGPNHTGLGRPVSLMSSGKWEMPTGELNIDDNLAGKLLNKCRIIEEDSLAHQMEHSLEVQLPFILNYVSSANIVPAVMKTDSLEDCREVGETVAEVIMESEYPVTIIASSDMSHYVSDSAAREKDKMAIDRIVSIDPEGLYHTVRDEGISMCGVIPVTTMLFAARKIGARNSRLVKYMTSGETSGDYNYVVGYAGVIVK
jgi:AmmeMemoRadiSam system protein B